MLKCSRSVGKEVAIIIDLEAYFSVIAADPQAFICQGVVCAVSIMSIKTFFIVNGMLFRLLGRLFRRRSFAFVRLPFVSICQQHNTFCQGALYQRDQCIRRGTIRFFYPGINNGVGIRQVFGLYGRGAEARRQYQGGQYGGGAPTDAAARALRAAVSQLGYDDVLMFYFTPYNFVYSIHTYFLLAMVIRVLFLLRCRENQRRRQAVLQKAIRRS